MILKGTLESVCSLTGSGKIGNQGVLFTEFNVLPDDVDPKACTVCADLCSPSIVMRPFIRFTILFSTLLENKRNFYVTCYTAVCLVG